MERTFRNRLVNHPNPAYVNDNCRIVLEADQTYYNIVGNVLGTVGYETEYNRSALDSKGIYNIDNKATTIIHGNWDSVTKTNGGIVWSTNPDRVIPSSYYLSAKPTWFGNLPWPPFDPGNVGAAAISPTNLPAGYRFIYGVDPGSGPANQPPVAVASANPRSGAVPLAVTFSSAGSSDPEGTALTYTWAFGDGGTSTAANPSHTYQSAGTYIARLTVSDGTNTTTSSNLTITVSGSSSVAPPPPQNLHVVSQ